jgi:hypothetical protein
MTSVPIARQASASRFKLAGPTLVQRHEPQEPQVVSEDRIDGVVVDEASEIEQHASLDAVEHMGRMTCHERGSRLDQRSGGPPDMRDRRPHHVRAPVGSHEDGVRLDRPHGGQYPVRDPPVEVGEGHPRSTWAGCEIRGMIS